jgi:hypothetical protein
MDFQYHSQFYSYLITVDDNNLNEMMNVNKIFVLVDLLNMLLMMMMMDDMYMLNNEHSPVLMNMILNVQV